MKIETKTSMEIEVIGRENRVACTTYMPTGGRVLWSSGGI
jgi:hypothetical protein